MLFSKAVFRNRYLQTMTAKELCRDTFFGSKFS